MKRSEMRLRRPLNISELLKIQHGAENGAFFSRTLTSFVSGERKFFLTAFQKCYFRIRADNWMDGQIFTNSLSYI